MNTLQRRASVAGGRIGSEAPRARRESSEGFHFVVNHDADLLKRPEVRDSVAAASWRLRPNRRIAATGFPGRALHPFRLGCPAENGRPGDPQTSQVTLQWFPESSARNRRGIGRRESGPVRKPWPAHAPTSFPSGPVRGMSAGSAPRGSLPAKAGIRRCCRMRPGCGGPSHIASVAGGSMWGQRGSRAPAAAPRAHVRVVQVDRRA